MTSPDTNFCIEANPDISGIGVRVAIYVQNLLSFVPAVAALMDGKVTLTELESVETQSMSILIMAFAILISTIIQALTGGLSNLHATIVLNLSWMNNTNTFIYFLLYMHHMSHSDRPREVRVKPGWKSWIQHASRTVVSKTRSETRPPPGRNETGRLESLSDEKVVHLEEQRSTNRSSFALFVRKFVLTLGSLHLTLMAAVGIWLWYRPGAFGNSPPCSLNNSVIVILGKSLPLSSRALHIWSLFMYSLVLLPGINLFLPVFCFLALYIWLNRCFNSKLSSQNPSIVPIYIGLGFIASIDLVFLINTELSIQRNQSLQQPEETSWTFGQTLALLLLLIPLRDATEALSERRHLRRIEAHIKEHTDSLQNALKSALEDALRIIASDAIEDLVRKGADVNAEVVDAKFPTALQFASYHGKLELAKILIDRGCNVNFKGGKYGTALGAAADQKHTEIVKLLLDRGADANSSAGGGLTALGAAVVQDNTEIAELLLDFAANANNPAGEFYGTALGAAAYSGNMKIVELLLDRGADVNSPAGDYGTALGAAACIGNMKIVELLLDRGADVNNPASKYGTALGAAAYWGRTETMELLLERGADANSQADKYGTALGAAAFAGNTEIVKILLDRGADPNSQADKSFGTALGAAAYGGNAEIVKLMLDHGANVNSPAGDYGKALGVAAYYVRQRIVRLLLDHGAEVNIQGGEYRISNGFGRNEDREEIVKVLREKQPDVRITLVYWEGKDVQRL